MRLRSLGHEKEESIWHSIYQADEGWHHYPHCIDGIQDCHVFPSSLQKPVQCASS